ncbi:putative alkaline shock family protein YloU [Arthrobacter ginsengisoli]|uniref:Alkaline shock family protein YloU n=1 Tax=Arthrobacter ginsengisoli TaxID=1356565 RepID=A0ABU1UIP1_9MICC|nr:Asp23/Gls24 family envelope stress response protein [Arthrobacter ginsengisoli]MDR7085062.1 putative alkaline shock family protein YloU [Arthrobacter ginsengisoli]
MNPQGAHALPGPRPEHALPEAGPGAGDGAEDFGETGGRGQTVLAARVIEKIASQVVSDESAAGGFLGIGTRPGLSARPKASVELSGNIATLSVEVGMLYPVPLRQATDALRRRIRTRVTELTGVDVRQIDIRISWLSTAADTSGRRKLL